jgi:membrane associated rhomboid family serine protease
MPSQLPTDTALTMLATGADHLDAGDAEAALAVFKEVNAAAELPIAARAALGAAEAYVRLGRDAEAADALSTAIDAGDRETRGIALRRLAAARVRTGDLAEALDLYRRAERDAPNDAARAEIASRIGWLAKETGAGSLGSRIRSSIAFNRARGSDPFGWVPLLLVIVTGAFSVASFLYDPLFSALALVKIYGGYDYLSVEPWRLLTVTLVHANLLHLLFNLFALDLGAKLIQRLYGGPRLVLWYLIGGVGASLTSAIVAPDSPTVGASGAIFALFGIALGAEWAHKPFVERGVRTALGQIGGLILVNIVFGLSSTLIGGGIDNGAHLGGLLTGLLLGAMIPPTRAEAMRRRWSAELGRRGGEALVTGALVFALAMLYLNWAALALLRLTLPI